MKTFRIVDLLLAFRRRMRHKSRANSGVLLISAGGLGDTVLFAHVLDRFLPLARDGEQVTVLLRRDASKMAFLLPDAVGVRAVDFGALRDDAGYRWRLFEELYDANLRLVVATDYLRHPHLDEALIAACDAPEALAMEPRPWPKYDAALERNRELYARLFDSGPPRTDKLVRWTRFANWLTGRDDPPPVARIPEERLAPPAHLDAPTVVVQPFSAVKAKQSQPALYKRIREALPDDYHMVIAGAPGDLKSNPDYEDIIDLPGVAFDASTFQDIVPLLRAAKLVISVDTAMAHLAIAVGAPTLCLGSAAYVGEIVPYDDAVTPPDVRFLYRPMECEGCLGDCVLPLEDGMYPCVARLDEDEVISGIKARCSRLN